MRIHQVLVPLAVLCCALSLPAQEVEKPAPPMSPFARLTSAKTIYLKSTGGSDIPYTVISSDMEGWGRYQIVKSPEKADLIMEITAPSEGGGGVTVSSSTKTGEYGRPEDSVSSSRELSSGGGVVKLVVYDPRSKAPLWSATEQAKSAMRQKAREDNLVQASEKIFTKFHDRIEPPAPAKQP